MVKKILSIFKTTIILWLCILIPLFVGMKLVQSKTTADAESCLDSFIQTECVGVAKNIGLQFLSTQEEIVNIVNELQFGTLEEGGTSNEVLQELTKSHLGLLSVNIYHDDGKFFASSGEFELPDKAREEFPDFSEDKLKDKISYSIDQLENTNEIVLKFYTPLRLTINGSSKDFIMELIIKWDRYETYMNKLQQGSFPRMFYIISPDCKRYVSMNSLPAEARTKKSVAALGMHLTPKIGSVAGHFSTQEIEKLKFRIYKEDIKIPEKLVGSQFFMVVAADEGSFHTVSKSLIEGIPVIVIVLVVLWLFISIITALFYSGMKDKLEIANTITESTPLVVVIYRASDGKILQANLSAKTLLRIKDEEKDTINMWNVFLINEDKEYVENAINSKIQVLKYGNAGAKFRRR